MNFFFKPLRSKPIVSLKTDTTERKAVSLREGRLTVPKVTAKEFLESDEESLNGYTAEVTLYPVVGEEDEEDK